MDAAPKNQLRDKFKSIRMDLLQHNKEEQVARGQGLKDNFIETFNFDVPQIIAGYSPVNCEIDLMPLMNHLETSYHSLCLPRGEDKSAPLDFHHWAPNDPLELDNHFKIMVPCASQTKVQPTVLLVPLVAFDKDGYRLGYGGGYYDRTINHLRTTGNTLIVGCAHDEQETDHIPRGPHDEQLDYILTNTRSLKVR